MATVSPLVGTSRRAGTLCEVDFAVIIPAFNDEACVRDAVESALGQDHLREVIVVDDGSEDRTSEVVKGIGDDRVIVLRQANAGPGAARNTGAASATASHLVFLDADDELLPGALARFAYGHANGCRFVRSGATVTSVTGESLSVAEPHPLPYPRGAPLAGSFSIGHELFTAVGGYDPEFRFGENSELLLRVNLELQRLHQAGAFVGEATVRLSRRPDRPESYYRARRLASIEMLLSNHREPLRADPETLSRHHAVASHLHRQSGSPREARHHALAAALTRPLSARAWGRVARSILSPQ